MEKTKLSGEELMRLGTELYAAQIRDTVETQENENKICVVDVLSGDYEIDRTGVLAGARLRERRPEGAFWGERIGHPEGYTFGVSTRVAGK